jgi:hypothetical protein
MKVLSTVLAVSILSSLLARAAMVTTLTDSGPGSLRAAVAAGGTINFSVTGTIALTSGEIVINLPVAITGPGANQLVIQRSTAAGTPEFRVFRVRATSVISGVTLSNGLIGSAYEYDEGACVLNDSSLTLLNCAVTDNNSVGAYTRGTGIKVSSDGRLTAVNCLFARNIATGFDSEGSAIYNYGSMALTNCTFSGNSAGYSAAIQNDGFSKGTIIESCTVVSNAARFVAGIYNGGFAQYFSSDIFLRNSIVAGNIAREFYAGVELDIENRGATISGGYNLIGKTPEASYINPVRVQPSDQVDLSGAELRLGPLADNGGPTLTHALLTGSPALEAGPFTGFPATDQRGVARPFGLRADIGAFESDILQPLTISCLTPLVIDGTSPDGATATLMVTVMDRDGHPVDVVWWVNGVPRQTNHVSSPGSPLVATVSFTSVFPLGFSEVVVTAADGVNETVSCPSPVNVRDVFSPNTIHVNSLADWGVGTLRHAIQIAPSNGVIVFRVRGVINLTRGELRLDKGLNILGPGADLLAIQRSEEPDTPPFRIFSIVNYPTTISGLTIRNGYLPGTTQDDGAGLENWTQLTLRDCVIRDNRLGGEASRGAGVQNWWGGRLSAINCTFVNNQGLDRCEGGAIYNYYILALTNCTISGNFAAATGGALHNDALSSNVFIHSCTIVGNRAGVDGAAIYNNGFNIGFGDIAIRNSIVAGNPTPPGQAEIYNRGVLTSLGYNLFGTAVNGPAAQPGDQFNVTIEQLRLTPLQNNGGHTPTHALLPRSIALNTGGDVDCLPTDQRGVTRPHYAFCDIGAFEADQLPPDLQCAAAVDLCRSTGPETVTLTVAVEDMDGDALTVVWFVNGVAWQTNNVPASLPSVSATLAFTGNFMIGTHTVTVVVSDGRFAPTACSTTVTVGDSVPPIIACLEDRIVATDPGQCSAVVTYTVTATDNCSAPAITCLPASGTSFPKGVTTVNCTATDAAGNQSRCSFRVTVQDRQPPVIQSLNAMPSVLLPANHEMVPVTIQVTAGDNCGAVTSRIVSVTSSDPVSGTGRGDRAPDWQITGPLNVNLRAELSDPSRSRTYQIIVETRDTGGNTARRSTIVTVPARRR